MINKRVMLEEGNEYAYLDVYASEELKDFTRSAILIVPGGGYGMCAAREGEPIAMAFLSHGFNAFVLNYSAGHKAFPAHLIEASMAVKHIRDNAEEYRIDPDKVFVVGFSAGGHLAASLGTMWDRKEIYDAVPMSIGYNKPNGMMLIYPVLSAKHHGFSFRALFKGEEVTDEKLAMVSIENCINENSSPAFIMHTSNDEIVDVKNSLVLADALAEKKIKFEMHIYPDAPHGVALGNEATMCGNEKWCNPAIAKWVEQAVYWSQNI